MCTEIISVCNHCILGAMHITEDIVIELLQGFHLPPVTLTWLYGFCLL